MKSISKDRVPLSFTWLALVGLLFSIPLFDAEAASSALLGWNNLGMHCMDRDFSVFSILPPYNTIEAQLIVGGKLVTNGAYTLTYEAIPDATGSINRSSVGKGNFYEFGGALYAPLAPDAGLAGWGMPGPGNAPQPMLFERTNQPAPGVYTRVNWFRAEGIPITPYDDNGFQNPYPMMRVVARNSSKVPVATNDIVLPVSDEMDCRACHGAGTQAEARPFSGWVSDPNPEREYRLNILLLHDEREFAAHPAEYAVALAARGFSASGLFASVTTDQKPVLCASCHASEALGAPSYGNIPPLTASIHGFHAHVMDPALNLTLDDSANRASCYRCHPGSATKCLRGAMGSAVAADGSMQMQCQSCHGSMSQVGAVDRVGWFMEPACQSCHTGTATHNNGQIRYTSVFTDNVGTLRTAVDRTFATSPNTPAAGLSLYRFSTGHGGLQCSACHGSTHAEFPSSHANDNVMSTRVQGHAGVVVECTACHATMPTSATGGPHGMHPIGQGWVGSHGDVVESGGIAKCQACHGTDNRGTVLSRVQGRRTFSVEGATVSFYRGATVGCYSCHNGPSSESLNTSAAPTAKPISTNTPVNQAIVLRLPITGTGAKVRILSQPSHGTVGLNNTLATYFPDPGYAGVDTFTFAAYNGAKNSALATATVKVGNTAVPLITVVATDSVAGESLSGRGIGQFTLTRSGDPTTALAINVSLGGTGNPGQDYEALPSTVTFAAGSASVDLPVSPIEDTLPEFDETVTLEVVAGSGYAVGSPASATLALIDDDCVTQPLVSGFVPGTRRNNTSSWRGLRFKVGAKSLKVAQLGRVFLAGNQRNHALRLVRASDNALIASVTWTPAGGIDKQIKYVPLPASVLLTPNTEYYVASQEVSGGDTFFSYNTTIVLDGTATPLGSIYSLNGTTWTKAGTSNSTYGPVGLVFCTPVSSAPAPAPVAGPPLLSSPTTALVAAASAPTSPVVLNPGGSVVNGFLELAYVRSNRRDTARYIVEASPDGSHWQAVDDLVEEDVEALDSDSQLVRAWLPLRSEISPAQFMRVREDAAE